MVLLNSLEDSPANWTIAKEEALKDALQDGTLEINSAGFQIAGTDFQDASLTFTNKTIDTANNTLTIVEADISDLGSYITSVADDATPQLSGDLDGQSTYDITNVVNAGFSGYLDIGEITPPTDPAANTLRLFAEDDGGFSTLHVDDASGVDFDLTRDSVLVVRNTTGSTLTKGDVVYINGSNGSLPTVALADASTGATMPSLGVVIANISNNSNGQIIRSGIIDGIDTSAYSDGDELFVSTTPGAFTNTEPTGSSVDQQIATVVKGGSVGAGVLFVNVGTENDPTLTQTLTNKTIDTANNTITINEADISDLSHYDGTDFDTDFAAKSTTDLSEGTNLYYTDERAQDAVGTILVDSTEIDFTYTDATPEITASLVASSIDETKLDASVNASLDLADSSTQPGDNVSSLTNDAGYIADITAEVLSDLSDVTITTVADNEFLTYDSGTGDWINQTAAEVGVLTDITGESINDLSDVAAASPTIGDYFQYTAQGDWENVPLDISDDPSPALGGALNASDNDIQNVKLAEFQDEHDNGNSGTTATIDWGNGNGQKITLTGNVTLSFTAPSGPGWLQLRLIQDGTGSRTVTWPTVKWPGGTAPSISTAASAEDVISFYYNGTSYYGVGSLDFQ